MVSGRIRSLITETDVRLNETPNNRRSTMKIVPANNIKDKTWVASSSPQKFRELASRSVQDGSYSPGPLPTSVAIQTRKSRIN